MKPHNTKHAEASHAAPQRTHLPWVSMQSLSPTPHESCCYKFHRPKKSLIHKTQGKQIQRTKTRQLHFAVTPLLLASSHLGRGATVSCPWAPT